MSTICLKLNYMPIGVVHNTNAKEKNEKKPNIKRIVGFICENPFKMFKSMHWISERKKNSLFALCLFFDFDAHNININHIERILVEYQTTIKKLYVFGHKTDCCI